VSHYTVSATHPGPVQDASEIPVAHLADDSHGIVLVYQVAKQALLPHVTRYGE